MNNIFELLNNAVFNSVKAPFFILTAVFILLTAVTIGFVVHEVKKQKNDTE